jgi:hypothetical protein
MSQIIPAEHDARQFELIQQASKAEDRLFTLRERMHHMAGDRKRWYGKRQVWSMSWAEVSTHISHLAVQGDHEDFRHGGRPSQLLERDSELLAGIGRLDMQAEAMEAEWRCDPWTRYFPCLNSDGHVHATLRGCPTVKRDTAMSWATELSGKTVDEAIDDLGPRLCSVCFPGAPVEHCRSLRDITREQREAEKAARAAQRQADADARAARAAERATKAAQPRKPTPQERRWAAMKDLGKRFELLAAEGRTPLAEAIRELDQLGKAPKWHDAISAWAGAVLDEENDINWAFTQYSVWASSAA